MIPDSPATERGHRAQRLLNSIVGASPEVIYVYHALRDRIAFLGRQVHDVLGCAAVRCRRLRLAEFERLVHPADRPGLRRHLAAFERAADGEVLSHEVRIKAADGDYRWLRGRGTVLARTPDGRVAKVVVANQDLTDVIEAKASLRELSGRLYALREEERQRIAQELHDSTAQHLVAATLNLMTLRAKAVSYPGVNGLLESVETSLEEATRELRAFTYLLHPLALENDGLEKTLRTYLDGFSRRTRIEAQMSVAGEVERLPFPLQRSLLRIIQEALANVHRHAAASHVSIGLRTTADTVELIVADDGRGMRAEPTQAGARNGMGIPGMRARVREFDGRLEIRSGSRGGTTIVVRIPLGAVRRRPTPAAPELELASNGRLHRLD